MYRIMVGSDILYYLIGIVLIVHVVLFSVLVYIIYKLIVSVNNFIDTAGVMLEKSGNKGTGMLIPIIIGTLRLARRIRKGVIG